MLRVAKISPETSHDELFIERYQRLLTWSLKLTDNNRELAEDLVQDAFVQFTFTRPDLARIENLDGYLYGMLRHLHLSQVRRATRNRLQPLSIIEYESAEIGLRSIDPRTQIQVQDELRRVCHYACARKQQSKSASVLILRFFHGYYPSEIVQILRSSRQAIRKRLQIARTEARLALENPKALGFIGDNAIVETIPTTFARTPADFLIELRHTIFRSRKGDCFSSDQLEKLYRAASDVGLGGEMIDSSTLAHLVACSNCLDAVNHLLALPSLEERYPTDSLEKEKKRKDGPGGGTTGGGTMKDSIEGCRRRARETFEHEPQELCVAVNGYLQGTQKISSELSELTLNVKDEEKINFVEIFSEQDIRLLFMNVDEFPPEGPSERHLSVALSDTRKLDLTLRFRSPWPTLHVAYRDPAFAESAVLSLDAAPGVESQTTEPRHVGVHSTSLPRSWLRSLIKRRDWAFFLRPATITAAFALLLIAALVFVQFRHRAPVVTAASLLNQSAIADEAIAARIDTILHRTINLEQRSSTGELITSRKVEIWQSGAKGITARRLFDEKGALLAGEWTRSDNVSTLYHHGVKPQLQLRNPKSAIRNLDDVWQLSLSAKDFIALVDQNKVHLEERPADYVLTFADESNSDALVNATLLLSRSDLHATEMTLVIKSQESGVRSQESGSGNRQYHEYHFTESSFERRAPNTVAPAVFEPEAILLEKPNGSASNTKSSTATEPANSPPSVIASRELEVEVLSLLNRAGADLGEQVSVTRAAEGFLRVQAIVDSDRRKSELQEALASVKSNPAVKIDIATRTEAASRQNRSGNRTENVTIQEATPAANSLPVDAELRRYFSGASGEQLELSISRFSNRTLSRSLQIMQHAWALKRLAERFSSDDLQTLEPQAKAKWLSMIRGHAQVLEQQTSQLQRELSPVFPGLASADGRESFEIKNNQDLVAAIERLFALCSENEHVISAAFTISPDASKAASIRSQNFWRSLKSAEGLAASLQRSER